MRRLTGSALSKLKHDEFGRIIGSIGALFSFITGKIVSKISIKTAAD
jgi:hypothetical protein